MEFDDEDYNELFITQESKEDVDNVNVVKFAANNDGDGFQFGVHNLDIASPCVSLVENRRNISLQDYSDIFDDEYYFEQKMDTADVK